MAKLTEKTVKDLKKSKAQIKIENSIFELETKQKTDGLTVQELRRLANAKHKLEDRSPSKLYKSVKADFEAGDKSIVELLGKSKFPTFKDFAEKLPIKLLFSKWDAFGILAKCNKAAVARTKVKKQGGEVVKKAA